MRSHAASILLGALSMLTAGVLAEAHDEHGPLCSCAIPRIHQEGTPPPGKPRDIPHTDERAGWPRTLAGHLKPSVTPGGIGYHVGGGTHSRHGEPRAWDEGTWGWDETGGTKFRTRVRLLWSHGRRYQGGTGAYRTDGHPIPDVFAGFNNAIVNRRGNDH
jgi:hypothetical protein